MSTYEDYGRASSDYDASRVAVGSEIVLGAMAHCGIRPSDAHLLDAGCGTGGYSVAVAPHVGAVTMVDASAEMLVQAKARLAEADAVTDDLALDLLQGLLPDLAFDDAVFDAVMVNQVLHHLGDEEGGTWEHHRAALAEIGRVLRPGGVLVLNTCSQAQLRRSYWYYALIPAAADALRRRYAPIDDLEEAMAVAGLRAAGRFVPVDQTVQGAAYFDGRAPLDEVMRNGDSAWSLTSDQELAAALEQVRSLEAEGKLDAFVSDHDAERHLLGQITFVTARRSDPLG